MHKLFVLSASVKINIKHYIHTYIHINSSKQLKKKIIT